MDGNHPKNIDPRPKRRKDKDNPYEIFTTGLDTVQPHYFLAFVDSTGVEQCMEIDKVLFDTFNRFELDDLSFMNKVDRHYERSEQTEVSLNKRAAQRQESLEETVFRQVEAETLYQAITKLTEKQRSRLTLYYFANFTYKQIAEMEGCTISSIKGSIDGAIEKLKNILK